MVSLSTVLVIVYAFVVTTQAINPKTVLNLLQQQTEKKKAIADCSQCTQANQFCDLRSWSNVCKSCPVCGVDRFCDGRGYCERCPGTYAKPTQLCQRVTANDISSQGQYVEGQPVKLIFTTVGDDFFYLAAEPNRTCGPIPVDLIPQPVGNGTHSPPGGGNITSGGGGLGNDTSVPPEAAVAAGLSTDVSWHVIEEITEGSGNYRIRFNDACGGFLRVVPPPEPTDPTQSVLLEWKTFGVTQVFRDYSEFTTFQVEHAASLSWRFRTGTDDNPKYLAWCGQSGVGVPALRAVSGIYCGSLTTAGIRCDVMLSN